MVYEECLELLKLIQDQDLKIGKEEVDNEILNLISRSPQSEKEIRRFYKKPSNKKRIEDDLMEKEILNYLEQYADINELEIETKTLREQENAKQ